MRNIKSTQHLTEFNRYLNEQTDLLFPDQNVLNRAIRYSLLAEGKRIRPLFSIGFCEAFGGDLKFARACGLTIEMIHAYSLIHDDLPAMDNDDFRRGKPTNHKVFGEAFAILAGDALLNEAPDFLISELKLLGMKSETILQLASMLLKASGHRGMIKGQALDIQCEKNLPPSETQKTILEEIHRNKTGQLIAWSCIAGLYSTNNELLITEKIKMVEQMGHDFGLLFQMIDDLLDVSATLEQLGKTPGKDAESGKLTYVSCFGTVETKNLVKRLISNIETSMLNAGFISSGGELLQEILQGLKSKID